MPLGLSLKEPPPLRLAGLQLEEEGEEEDWVEGFEDELSAVDES